VAGCDRERAKASPQQSIERWDPSPGELRLATAARALLERGGANWQPGAAGRHSQLRQRV